MSLDKEQSTLATDSTTMRHDPHTLEEAAPKEPLNVPASDYATGKRLLPVIFAIVLSVFLVSLDQTIVGTAIPKITDEFRGLDKVSWYGSAYFMTFGGFQSLWGKIYKYFNLRMSFLAAIFVFEVGSLICAIANNSDTFIVGRAIAGLGGAGLATGGFTIIAFAVQPTMRPQLVGLVGSIYGLGAVAGPLLGGVFSDKVSWRWCFYINLPVGGLAAGLTLLFFRTPSHAKPAEASKVEKLRQMDLVGAVLVMGAIISFILAMEYGGQSKAWSDSTVVGLLVGFVVISIAFGAWEILQGERAMVVPRLLKQRSVWVGCLYQFFFAGSYFVLLYYLPIYFQSIDNATPIGSGVRNLPMIIALTIASALQGVIVAKIGRAAPILVIGPVIATIGAGLLYTLDVGTSSGKWIGYQILSGVGVGVSFQVCIMVAQAHANPDDMASVTAIIFFFQILGGAFSLSAAQSAFVNKMVSALAITAPDVDAAVVVATGATQIWHTFTADQVAGVVLAYMEGLKVTFAIATALVGVAFLLSLCASWKRLPAGASMAVAAA